MNRERVRVNGFEEEEGGMEHGGKCGHRKGRGGRGRGRGIGVECVLSEKEEAFFMNMMRGEGTQRKKEGRGGDQTILVMGLTKNQ